MKMKSWFLCGLMVALFSFSSHANKIQLAILLDRSGSMEGLIDQTKIQLSNIINALNQARHQEQIPTLEIALFQYGKEGMLEESGYLEKLSDFVRDPDVVNQKLFQIVAGGSEEYCGLVIQKAVTDLNWSEDPTHFRVIFIAGNETMKQGPVTYADAIGLAKSRGIIVNTIFAGNVEATEAEDWREAASLGDGMFTNIDDAMSNEHIPTVLDGAILELNKELNKTYVPYGAIGNEGFGRMLEMDANMGSHLVTRASTKSGHYYDNSGWDLVTAREAKLITINDSIDRSTLVEEMREMSIEHMNQYLDRKWKERTILQKHIQNLSVDRLELVRDTMVDGSQTATVDKAIMATLKEQLTRAGFTL